MGYNKTAEGHPIYALATDRTPGHEPFKQSDGSEQMNINGTVSGTQDNLWDGTGGSDSGTPDWTVTGTGSETSGSMHAGTNGWDSGVAAKDGETVFDNGSMVDIDGTYQSLEFWMNPQAFPSGSFLSLQWLDSVDGSVGSQLDVNDYVTNFDTGVWQKVTIPIADFILPGNAQKLKVVYRKVANQHFYFDEFKLNQSGGGGGPYVFQIAAPDASTKYHVGMVVLVIADDGSGWLADTFGALPKLENGVLLRQRRLSTGEVLWSFNSKDNTDLFGRYHPQDDITFGDGSLLIGFMIKPSKSNIVVTNDDVLEYVVRDDLTGLTSARAFAHWGTEVSS